MKSGYTHITFILDRTGSMDQIKSDTIGGFNTFIDEQKKVKGYCTITLAQFDSQDPYEILNDMAPLDAVKKLSTDNFIPRGMTPLRDAIGRGINETGAKLAAMDEKDRPEKVIFVILTDGLENDSKEFDHSQILKMITRQKDEFNWDFVYLGANQDAIQVGTSMGIKIGNTLSFGATSKGTTHAFASASRGMATYRCSSVEMKSKSDYFDDEDRENQKGELSKA